MKDKREQPSGVAFYEDYEALHDVMAALLTAIRHLRVQRVKPTLAKAASLVCRAVHEIRLAAANMPLDAHALTPAGANTIGAIIEVEATVWRQVEDDFFSQPEYRVFLRNSALMTRLDAEKKGHSDDGDEATCRAILFAAAAAVFRLAAECADETNPQ